MEKGRIYVCDEEQGSREYLRVLLEGRGYAVECFAASAQLLMHLDEFREQPPDVILLDVRQPGFEGLEALRRIKAARPETGLILVSSFATVRTAVEAMKQGALDYLAKPVVADDLTDLLEKVVERTRLVEENRSLKAEIRRRFDPDQVIFRSSQFKRVFELAKKVAPSDASVLILGESGTGKELIASTIHYSSRRRDQRFLTINCAALTDTLLESQLFGHVKGAFTGAVGTQRGLVEEADRGTLFLDEIGDVSASLQAKLLRVLQEREFIPVGSTRVRHADVRFIAATNRDLEAEVAKGNFREDLYYRLNVVTLNVPPLRERRDDIQLLAEFFLRKYASRGSQGVSGDALALLRSYDWPGNVRELENVIEMAAILADGREIAPEHLPVKVAEGRPVEFALPQEQMSMAELEARYIEQVFRQTRFHKVKTSQILQISRKTLDRKLQQYDISREE
ncbi:sigma-54-dependent Fis family transcriptional regulator [Desulfuromonas versatilis]|uniref:DNA-binding transcriptional regulator NtrC n=1 Tax=Desulfuromonas versatilis TaxID=2802975 RepID=A0ABN6E2H7_9BACT|nr:sigma-54 dependent transcriptional regulator [Desulfuromonas versatilis]BCR06576.1 sigma-54-dependent Fis family transcriptional regulator [Desulfuromonas versatilis]